MGNGKRRVQADHIVGTREIARRLGVPGPQTVALFRKCHDDFPPPIAVVGKALVWDWPDVEAWARRANRRPTRHLRALPPPGRPDPSAYGDALPPSASSSRRARCWKRP